MNNRQKELSDYLGTPLFNSVNDGIQYYFGEETEVISRRSLYGGDINEAYRLELSSGECVFLKKNTGNKIKMFLCEAHGLKALSAAGAIGIPKVYGVGRDQEEGSSFLLMQFLNAGARNQDYWEVFGRELAMMHLASTDSIGEFKYGFFEDNYIGLNPQINKTMDCWTDFFRECRLIPQINMAKGLLDPSMMKKLSYLIEHLERYLAEPEKPSLLHGDLWSGNAVCGPDGKAWIIDPAVYVGDSETDLAMTQLFGGFPAVFYKAYHECKPIDAGYKERKKIYQLYHLLNHVNLFGRSYLWEVDEILNYYCG